MLESEELKRYQRHLQLPNFTLKNQESLKASSVLIIGIGGLGGPVLQYLSAAGVGTIGLADFDTVSLNNLQRQVLFTVENIGRTKVECAKQWVEKLNPNVIVKMHHEGITEDNALKLIENYDIVVDGTDTFRTRYLINDACIIKNKPWVMGSMFQYEGQVSLFNFENGPSYRCLYPQAPKPSESPSCSEAGVLGVLPSIIGSFQALEVIKAITGISKTLSAKLLIFNAMEYKSMQLNIDKNLANFTISSIIPDNSKCSVDNISAESIEPELANKGKQNFQFIDVRMDWEFKMEHIKSTHFPMWMIEQGEEIPETINSSIPTIVYCQYGNRSIEARQLLIEKYNFSKVYSLEGGIDYWIELGYEVL
jgi:adenylyltransferase/sulfurtransferase